MSVAVQTSEPGKEESMKVLVVEDAVDATWAVERTVRSMGHKVDTVHSGNEGLVRLSEDRFDLVLLDLFLADGMGHDFIKEIKKLQPEIWIVSMADKNSRELETAVRREGVVYHMIKPFDREAVKSILDHMRKRRTKADQSRKKTSAG